MLIAVEDENIEDIETEENAACDAEENVVQDEEQQQDEEAAQSGSAEEQEEAEEADNAETADNNAEEQVEAVEEEPEEEEQPMTPEEIAAAAPWKEAFEKLHPTILRGLREAGFTEPTAIQKEVMKPALLARKDVIGAAETVRPEPLTNVLINVGINLISFFTFTGFR